MKHLAQAGAAAPQRQSGIFTWVERVGNKIPNPFLLFIYLIVLLMVATCILSYFHITAFDPVKKEPVAVKNLLSVEGLQWILPNVIKNFTGFTPLGYILALVIGVGLAEKVGLLEAIMRKMASKVDAKFASYLVVFIAFFSHVSSDAAVVIMPPLGALIFLAVGRHPVAGLLAAIAGVGSGFTANLLIVTTDVLLSGISGEVAKSVNTAATVTVLDNWYFMAASVIVLTVLAALITDKFVEPRLGKYEGEMNFSLDKLTDTQNKGLRWAGIAAIVYIIVVALMVVPHGGILRDPKTGSVIPSPFMSGIVPIIIFFFFTIAVVYGLVTKAIKNQNDIPSLLGDPMKHMAGFIVMVFPLSQFVAFFNWSNMGKFMALSIIDVLEKLNMTGVPVFVGLMFLSALLTMFIASGSAIWSILAPVFVPMFMLLGFHPAFAQIVFRVADSSVIPFAPMSPFLPLFLSFLQRYRKDAQLGTYYSLILPYPIAFFIVWTIMLIVWYMLGLPIGPGVYPRM
ncbi:p-aminobenzoyl-glutamate transporter [Paenibacillus sp. TAB 01]|uniref:p-aminobenzoyl-glutamate transporter n=1 Tax=Paenibacillus sp. TAB 01 TaxID=3368988 RepID=UPI003752878C